MQLLLARRVNGHALPEHVTFIAATNRRTDRAGVTGILEPVKSRFASIVELVADVDEWCVWALAQDFMPPEIVAFLRFRGEMLNAFSPSADLTNSPTPRTWAHAAKLIHLGLPAAIETEALKGTVGEGAAVELQAFRRLYQELPSIDGILVDPDSARIPDQPATLYAVSTALGMRANAQTFGRIARYAHRLLDDAHGEFATLLVRDAQRRDPSITQTPDFVRLMSGPLGQLVTSFGLLFAAAAGARPIVTNSSDAKLERAVGLGAAGTVNYRRNPEWHEEVLAMTDGAGVKHVLDIGGEQTVPPSLQAMAHDGHLALIGGVTGFDVSVPRSALFPGGISVTGVYVDSREDFEAMNAFIEGHDIRPVIDRAFEFEDAPTAFEFMRDGGYFGKIVIRH